MGDSPYIIRSYCRPDFDSCIRLQAEAERLDATGRYISPRTLSELLGRPGYSPEKGLVIAEIAGEVAGYTNVVPELGIGRVVLDCVIHPDHRRQGVATRLFHHALHQASGLGARVAHVNIQESNVAARSLLSRLGFIFVRRFLELRLELSQAQWQNYMLPTLTCRPLQQSEEDKLTEIQNRSFAGTWGYCPNTKEEIVYRVNLSDCSPEGIILVCQGDRPVGYCWTTINWEENRALGTGKGRIYMLGVDPDYRGTGMGRQVLVAGLYCLQSKGLQVAELTVDSENKVACALYDSLGFSISSTTAWYEKALD